MIIDNIHIKILYVITYRHPFFNTLNKRCNKLELGWIIKSNSLHGCDYNWYHNDNNYDGVDNDN